MKIFIVALFFSVNAWSSIPSNVLKKTIEVHLVLDHGNAVTVIEEEQEKNLKGILKKRFGITDFPDTCITKTPERIIRVLLHKQSYNTCIQSVNTGRFQYLSKPAA